MAVYVTRAIRTLVDAALPLALVTFGASATAQTQPYYPPQYPAPQAQYPAPQPQYPQYPQQYPQYPAPQQYPPPQAQYPVPPPQYPAAQYPAPQPQYPAGQVPYYPQSASIVPAQYGVMWVPAQTGGPVPPNAVFGGTEANGNIEHVCRAPWQGGVHPGKLTNGGHCYIAYGRNEIKLTSYEVLTSDRTYWSSPHAPTAVPVVGGRENGRDLMVCRGKLWVDGTYRGEELGKYFDGKCDVSYGGHARFNGLASTQ